MKGIAFVLLLLAIGIVALFLFASSMKWSAFGVAFFVIYVLVQVFGIDMLFVKPGRDGGAHE